MDLFLWLIEGGGCGAESGTLPLHPYTHALDSTCWAIKIAGWAGAILGFFTMFFAVSAMRRLSIGEHPTPFVKRRLGFLTMLWAILPPLWMWFEYWGLYMGTQSAGFEGFAQFKYNQLLVAAIWLGILAFAALVLNRTTKGTLISQLSAETIATEMGAPEPNRYVVTIFKSGSNVPKDGKEVWFGSSRVKAVTKFLDEAEKIKAGEDIKLTQENVLRFHKISERKDTIGGAEDDDE